VGETVSGVPYDVGVQAAREIAALTPPGWSTAQLALRWVLDQPGVSAVIPGARNARQALDNVVAAHLDPLPGATLAAMADIYDHHIRRHVHDRW
jgi:aryl-alcohol dehydrogenase-like predicted oxidoreductase